MKRTVLTLKHKTTTLLLATLCCLATAAQAEEAPAGVNWPSYRGPQASGVAEGFATATTWDVAKGENVRWKTAIPGLGHSSPVIWGDRLFITTATSGEEAELKVGLYGDIASVDEKNVHAWWVYCLDKKSGAVLWKQKAHEGVPKVKRHTKATHANATPATDGQYVVAFFGSEGLFVYDMEGKLKWKKDFGVLDSGFFMFPGAQWGFGSSPVIHDDMVIVQVDVQKDSFLAAYRLNDGSEVWRTPRDEVPTWSTPTVWEGPTGGRVFVNGFKHIGGYELATGKEVWTLKGGGDIPVPTPIVAHGHVYITNAHGAAAPIYAVRTDAKGKQALNDGAAAGAITWGVTRGGGYMQTPLVYGDYLYVCRDNGVLSCYDAKTGEQKYQERLSTGGSGFTASPVAADGKLYFSSEVGEVYVVKPGPTFALLAENELDEITMATPAISAGTLYFRTRGHVVAIAPPPATKAPAAEAQAEPAKGSP